jgi:hypothetical protein
VTKAERRKFTIYRKRLDVLLSHIHRLHPNAVRVEMTEGTWRFLVESFDHRPDLFDSKLGFDGRTAFGLPVFFVTDLQDGRFRAVGSA